MRSLVQSRSYGSVRVFWLDRSEAVRRLRAAARRLLEACPQVEEVRLFGSLATDRAVPGSDADVLILLETVPEVPPIDRAMGLDAHFADVGIAVDLFCYSREEAARAPFARAALSGSTPLAVRS